MSDESGTAVPETPRRQEWTLRLLALASVVGLTLIGWSSIYTAPESPAIVMSVVSALTTLVGSIAGAKAALSPPGESKVQ